MKTVIVLLLLATSAFSQQAAGPPPAQPRSTPAAPSAPNMVLPPEKQASREDIARMFKAVRLEQTMHSVQDAVMSNMQQLMDQAVSKDMLHVLTPKQRERYDAFNARNSKRAQALYPIKEMLEDFTPVYQRYFTKADVDVVVAFYTSPAGVHMLDLQPELMREGMAATMPKLQERLGKMTDEMRREAEDIFKPDADESPAVQPKKKS